jgi:hypothetical protein
MHFLGQIQFPLFGDQLVVIGLGEEQHIADHPRHRENSSRLQHLFQLLLAAALA